MILIREMTIMLLVKALAGTGKSTTAKFGLGIKVPRTMKMSYEQKEVIKLMRSMKWGNCAAQAFNTTIADALKSDLASLPSVEAATCNAFGHRAWLKFIGKSMMKPDAFKSSKLFRDISSHLAWKDKVRLEGPVCQLVGLCKSYMLEPIPENLSMLCDRFDIDASAEIFEYTYQVFTLGLDGKELIDYNDQVFLPLYHGIKVPEYDMVLVDELQDLNIAKQMFAFKMCKEFMVGIGDEHQAIYGFSGADSDAMKNFGTRMKSLASTYDPLSAIRLGSAGYTELPLTITRRCPKEIVREANRYVPELRAADNAPDGEVCHSKESMFIDELCKDEAGRMVLCRTNAPLTSLAFRLIAKKRRCFIQGKDIGQGIKRDIQNTNEHDLDKAVAKALEKLAKKRNDISTSKFPDEAKMEAISDRMHCITVLSDGCNNVAAFASAVDALFKDRGSPGDVQLSSVHKSKGLEHKHVCIYKPQNLPFKKLMKTNKDGTPSYQCQQELNLAYVAYTRSQDKLTYVIDDTGKSAYGRDSD